ncbi:MAG: porin [Xanthobacteraceae bacterium]
MKMVKSLLLGSAAGLVAVTAGQAAELPVKARPVQYVKICSLYGAGFYYMPGTDMCIKIGGWVRAEVTEGINGSSTTGLFNADYNNRYTNNLWTRERGYITADAREQTAYGVARAYIAVGVASNNNGAEIPASQANMNRAFVQWAGFTAGLAQSFFDFYPAAALLYRAGNIPNEDTGDAGQWVWAYTAQFGGGFSASLSAEERRITQNIDTDGAALPALGAGGTNGGLIATTRAGGYGGWQMPDVVANLRVDQAWGSAQVMGVLHQVNGGYYGALPVTGHPSDAWGWVAGAGIKINAPFISQGDYFDGEVHATQGGLLYMWDANPDSNSDVNGANEAFGVTADCVYGGTLAGANNTGCQLTSAWGLDVAYEHYWTPQWHQSLVYNAEWVRYNGAANAMLCVAETAGTGVGTAAVATAGCNNNWDIWGVGSRLQWDVTKSFYIGVEALYSRFDSATLPGGVLTTPVTLGGAGNATTVASQNNWNFTIRMHKDFLP